MLLLLDGSSLLARHFYGTSKAYFEDPEKNPLMSYQGLYINAVHGMAKNVIDLLSKYRPSHVVIAWDQSRKTFRNEIYPEYKANRTEKPDELDVQLPLAIHFFNRMGIFQTQHPDYEADDLIGSWSWKAEQERMSSLVVSGDKDLLQLSSSLTSVLLYQKVGGETGYTPDMVCAKFGLRAVQQLIDFKAIVGEKTDNIPGIPGLGEVTARKLLAEYYTLEDMLGNIEQIRETFSQKVFESLHTHQEIGLISKQLARIVRNIPEVIQADMDVCKLKVSMPDTFKTCQELGLFKIKQYLENRIKQRQQRRCS